MLLCHRGARAQLVCFYEAGRDAWSRGWPLPRVPGGRGSLYCVLTSVAMGSGGWGTVEERRCLLGSAAGALAEEGWRRQRGCPRLWKAPASWGCQLASPTLETVLPWGGLLGPPKKNLSSHHRAGSTRPARWPRSQLGTTRPRDRGHRQPWSPGEPLPCPVVPVPSGGVGIDAAGGGSRWARAPPRPARLTGRAAGSRSACRNVANFGTVGLLLSLVNVPRGPRSL